MIVHCALCIVHLKSRAIVMVRLLVLMVVPSQLFLAAVAVAAAELVDATSGVDEFLFAGEEGV